MPQGTLDRTPPSLFRQGPSAVTRAVVLSALAVFLMAADARLSLTPMLRGSAALALEPLQWVAMRPVAWTDQALHYFGGLEQARVDEDAARVKLARQALRAAQVEELTLENNRLRALLGLRGRLDVPATAAETLYEAPDPFTRRVVIGRGSVQGIVAGSPVLDDQGVLGQVTRVFPLTAEVTLVTDRNSTVPVLNSRTGARSVAYGDPGMYGGALELRFLPANTDVRKGDLLTTSGIDGVFPAGLPVARVTDVDHSGDSSFARVWCEPVGRVVNTKYVMVLKPTGVAEPLPPEEKPNLDESASGDPLIRPLPSAAPPSTPQQGVPAAVPGAARTAPAAARPAAPKPAGRGSPAAPAAPVVAPGVQP